MTKASARQLATASPSSTARGSIALELQMQQPQKAERGVGKLADEFERDVDDGAGRAACRRHPEQRHRAGAEHIAADLRQRQHLRAAVADKAGPKSPPTAGFRAAAHTTPAPSPPSARDGSARPRRSRASRLQAARSTPRRPRNAAPARPSRQCRRRPRGSGRASCGGGTRRAHELAGEPHQPGHRHRPQQAPVVPGHAAVVLGEADIEQGRDREVDVADRLAAGQREVVVLRLFVLAGADAAGEADALAHQHAPTPRRSAPRTTACRHQARLR